MLWETDQGCKRAISAYLSRATFDFQLKRDGKVEAFIMES